MTGREGMLAFRSGNKKLSISLLKSNLLIATPKSPYVHLEVDEGGLAEGPQPQQHLYKEARKGCNKHELKAGVQASIQPHPVRCDLALL